MPPKTVVFDLDGTLVDTLPDLMAALDHALQSVDLPSAGLAVGRSLIGQGARAMIERAFRILDRPLSPHLHDRLHDIFLCYYRENMSVLSRPFAGVDAALHRLRGEGMTLAVCTNKTEALSRQLLEEMGLIGHFVVIAGPDTYGVRKPDPRHLLQTIHHAGGVLDHSLFVGDSETDVETARAAGIRFLGVPFGYTEKPMVEMDMPMVDNFDALPDAVIAQFLTPPPQAS